MLFKFLWQDGGGGGVHFSKVAFVGSVLFHVILLSLRVLILTYTLHRYWEHGPELVMRPENVKRTKNLTLLKYT